MLKRAAHRAAELGDGQATTPLRKAIMGLLSIRPMSGYDVLKSYKRALLPIWYAPVGQVYPTLRAMREAGLLEVEIQVQHDRPNRKVYRLTPRGRRELAHWLGTPIGLPKMHHEFILKLFLMNEIAPGAREALVRSYSARCREWIDDLQQVSAQLTPALDGAHRDSVYFQLLSIMHLRRLVEAEVASAEALTARVANGRPGGSATRRGAPEPSERGPDPFGGFRVSPREGAAG